MLSKEVGQDSPENVSQNVIKQNLCILIPNCVGKVRQLDWVSSGGATSQFFPRLAHSDTIHISTACQNCVFVFKYLLLTWKQLIFFYLLKQLMVSSQKENLKPTFRNPRALCHPKKTEGIPEIEQALGLRAPAILTLRP